MWTCGRYNAHKHVAIMYNLIAGYSYFFESHSADVVGELLKVGRNEAISVEDIVAKTGIAEESILSFFKTLKLEGLLTTFVPTEKEVAKLRHNLSILKKQEPNFVDKPVKEKLPMAVSNAEMAYSDAVDDGETITSVLFELTYQCSAMCVHCYNPGATRNATEVSHRGDRKEMSLTDYKRVIDELYDCGLIKVCLSGGDPFSKPIVWEIIDYLYQKGIAFDIFTNGLRLGDKVQRLADYFPRLVGISIYSGIPEDHDAITRIPGSWQRSMQVVSELSDLAVPMNLKCCVMQPNLHSYYMVADLARQYGAQPQFEVTITESNDGDLCAKQLRLTTEQLQVVLRDDNIPLYVGEEAPNYGGQKRDLDGIACGAGKTSFRISPNGDMSPCPAFTLVFGNVQEEGVKHILRNSQTLQEWRTATLRQYTDCGREEYCDYCNLCSGVNYTEHHDFRKPAETNCHLAKARYQLAQALKAHPAPMNHEQFVQALQALPKAKVDLHRQYDTKG